MTKCNWLPLVLVGLMTSSCKAQNIPKPVPVPTPIPTGPATAQLNEWLRRHNPNDFTGKTWARFRILAPQNYQYAVIIDSETNPYKPERTSTGTMWATGLKPKPWPEAVDWGKPLPWVAPATDADWLRTGQYSQWVELPVSKQAQWHTAFIVRAKDNKLQLPINLNLELATAPQADAVFFSVAEPIDDKGSALVRMPTVGGLDGLKMVETFTDWAARRRQLALSLKLPPAVRPTQIKIGTWTNHSNYRAPGSGGSATREQAEPDFQTMSDLGLNSITPTGINQTLFGELAPKYGMSDTTLTGWASSWRYTTEGYNKTYEYQPGETPAQRWTRVFDDYYAKMAGRFKVQIPTSLAMAEHFNLGDEVHPATRAKEILETPNLLAYFRTWLRGQSTDTNWTPQSFGANSWDTVEPFDDRAIADKSVGDPVMMRRYYWTWQFINEYSIIYYKAATLAVRKNFPNIKFIAVNYQSGPVQNGFMGQNNAMSHGNIDIFEIGRQGAMQGVMMEDWVASTDIGAGFTSYGADVMRAAARKRDLPLAAYIVGNVPRVRFYAWMMQGVKEFGLYLFGPVSTIGPAWAENAPTLRQINELTREVGRFDADIAAAKLRPSKAAILVANTSDIMQRHGMYFASERQQLYMALRHSGVPVDLVSEQDVLEDNILNNYSLLYVVDPQVRRDVQRKVAGWVQNGGRLFAEVGAMNYDEYSQPSNILHPVLGVSRNDQVIQTTGNLRWGTLNPFSPRVGKFAFTAQGKIRIAQTSITTAGEITAWGMRLDATPTTGRVVGTYDDGKPAILVNSYGRGTAVLVGALTGEAYMRERYNLDYPVTDKGHLNGLTERTLATALVGHANIMKPAEVSVPGIYTSVMDAPNSTLVFLNKAFEAPVGTVTVRIAVDGNVRAIQSTKLGSLRFQTDVGAVIVQLPLENSDILKITR